MGSFLKTYLSFKNAHKHVLSSASNPWQDWQQLVTNGIAGGGCWDMTTSVLILTIGAECQM